ncbi:MAG: Ig-like domain-containing protein [Deltaproteobacteria bacterium]|nr:Ig-like domain-containing protein [Deltaproteobacteria bacterium]
MWQRLFIVIAVVIGLSLSAACSSDETTEDTTAAASTTTDTTDTSTTTTTDTTTTTTTSETTTTTATSENTAEDTTTTDTDDSTDTDDDTDDSDDAGDTDDDADDDTDDDSDDADDSDDTDDADDADDDTDDDDDDTGDTTAPTLSITTDAGVVITEDLLVTTTATFSVLFSEAVDLATVTDANIALMCGDPAAAQTIEIAQAAEDTDEIADNEFTVTPVDGLPEGSACQLTLGAGIADPSGNAIVETTISVTTCGMDDDFSNADSLDVCWTAQDDNAEILSAAIADGAATFTIASDVATGDAQVGFKKPQTASDLSVTAIYTELAGFAAASGQDALPDSAMIGFVDDTNATVLCGPTSNGGDGIVVLFYASAGEGIPASSETLGEETGLDQTLSVTITKSGDEYTCSYSLDGGEATEVGDPLAAELTDSYNALLSFAHTAGTEDLTAVLDAIEFE